MDCIAHSMTKLAACLDESVKIGHSSFLSGDDNTNEFSRSQVDGHVANSGKGQGISTLSEDFI